jgi:hypothetical protein
VIPYGPATITGILHCGTMPIRNAQLAVASVGCLPPGVQPIVGTVTTGLDGSFLYDVPPGPSRDGLLFLLSEHAGMDAKIEVPENWVDPELPS